MPELTSRLGLFARMFFYRRAFRRSKTICTVSAFSAARIRHYAAQAASAAPPVVVTYSALQHYILTPPEFPKTKTILFVGNIKKHKGLSLLLRAFYAARQEGLLPDYELVIAGSKERFRTKDRQARAELPGLPVRFTGPLPDEHLYRLYAEAALLVQPSLYEGFGLPPLEAMCLGTQPLISDIPVFREVYADFPVVFFRAGDSEHLAFVMTRLLRSGPPRITLSSEQKNRYTFQKTAALILSTLEKAF